ncbi:unnamed protein product, partial [Discosporangium mesarthrocarpum]
MRLGWRKSQRQDAVARFARELENRFGNMEHLVEKSVGVITAESLERGALEDLFSHRTCAIHIQEFYLPSAAAEMARWLEQSSDAIQNWKVSSQRGLESSDVWSVGKPYNMAVITCVLRRYHNTVGHLITAQDPALKQTRLFSSASSPFRQAYFDDAPKLMRRFREDRSFGEAPLLGPLDKLRLELDEIWPEGATVRKNDAGEPHLAGVARIMRGPTQYIDGFIHVDELAPMVPHHGIFSANVYLRMPPTGGELAIWPVAFRSRWDFYRHAETLSQLTTQGEEGQALLRKRLPSPLNIRVAAGDLVLLCVQRPHAAQGF